MLQIFFRYAAFYCSIFDLLLNITKKDKKFSLPKDEDVSYEQMNDPRGHLEF